jgi:hypothetical protein
VAAALWLWAASAAGAPVPFSGTLSIDLTAGTPLSVSGSGVADVTLSGSSVTALALPAGVFAGVATIPLTPSASPAVALRASLSNPTLLLSAGRPPCDVATPALGCLGSGPLHGRAGLLGLLRIGLLGTPASPLASLTLLAAPVGGAGSAVASNTVVAASARLVGAGWTTGPALAFATHAGGVVGTFARTGTANSAHIQVVTPFAVTTSVGPGSQPGFAILDLVFVPEPSVPVLLGAGVALALGLGARAGRRHG